MASYRFVCCKCFKEKRKLIDRPEDVPKFLECECGYTMSRKVVGPTTQVTESLDNGFMTKRVERLADAERLFQERNDATKVARGEKPDPKQS